MSISRVELAAAAQKAFAGSRSVPDAAESWRALSELGWLGLCVPQERGGIGAGSEGRAVIHHALGRALVPGPAIAQMMVIDALVHGARSDEADALLAAAMAGEVMTAPLAMGEASASMQAVPDADRATHVLHIGEELVALIPLAACEATHQMSWDETRQLFDVRVLREEDGLVLAKGDDAQALQSVLRTNALLSLAADALGGAEAVLAMTVDHLGTRRQFDRPLAMFQALKHRCADLRASISLVDALLWQDAGHELTLSRAGALKVAACRAYAGAAEEAVQLHGGIGLTMEHPCHLFLKRALLNCALGGDADAWEEAAGRQLLSDLASP